jgi:hypothetical protein
MSTKPKVVALVVILTGIAALVLVKQQQISELMAENAALRSQLSQLASLQDTNGYLAERLKGAAETSQASLNELLRLRGQVVRLRQLEQENVQLKSQRQQLDRQMQQSQAAGTSSEQRPTAVSEVVKATADSPPHRDATDLGSLELQSGIAAHFDLGGGTNCTVTPTALSDGNNMMEIKVCVTNADGTFSELGTSRLTALPGQHCSISVGDRMIALDVKMQTK